MNKEDALVLATRIRRDAPGATVEVLQDGIHEYYVDVTGQIQYKFVIKSDAQWDERRTFIVQEQEKP